MGQHLHENFNLREEGKAARLTEIEFEEMARALKAVASAHGRPCDDVIETFVRRGLAAALNLLATSDGAGTTAEYYHRRSPTRN